MSTSDIGARNQIRGTIRHIQAGDVVSEVELDTPAGIVTSVIFTSWLKQLGLDVGSEAVALVKATEVALGKPPLPRLADVIAGCASFRGEASRSADLLSKPRRIDMPLQHLIDYFNQRFIEENGLDAPPLGFDGQRVEGRFGELKFTSHLQPVRLATAPSFVAGYDGAPLVATPSGPAEDGARVLFADDVPNIVSLDRLSRTVHMLNYLPISHEDGYLFLHVHPRHVLTVKRDHGAYFEEIILRCGLSLRRVVITLTVSPVHDRQLTLLLERLKSYRDRGYATAIKFDDRAGDEFLERYCIEFLYRFSPDFVRFECPFFTKSTRSASEERRRASLLSAIRRLDTQLLIEGVNSETDAQLAQILNADFIKGEWYEQGSAYEPSQRVAGGRSR
jgi:molybdopterin-binding protein